ncbi:hypothetical protein LTR37_017853 [Vermiconidia calcicola]|uniref:Uncharacterized protein n=1 Tax=Vermiconidia calcicola TaxID=1690605 RepID=A0ACC3MIN8_9PEZI|nr:hypothetical protein LTR37_017853 [Vermiconidia calcicola]
MPPSTPNQYPPTAAFNEIIEIKVGENEAAKSFHMHKGILCFYSGYFKSALDGNFSEARTGVMHLPTEDSEVFEMFQYWAYQRRLCDPSQRDVEAISWLRLAQLWVFGDARQIPLLQNEVMDLHRKKVVELWQIPTGSVDHAYSHTCVNSPLRRFILDVLANTGGTDQVKSYRLESFSQEALVDLLTAV